MDEKQIMLIVDDVEANRASLSEIFHDIYDIVEAEDGEEALDRLQQLQVSIVILDLFMPGIDGFEVIRQMKADVRLQSIPIVAKTSIDEKVEARVLEMGVDEFIFYPCNPMIIRNRVQNVMRKHTLEVEALERQIAREKHTSQLREAFITQMSHELRTPINAILGITNLSRSYEENPQRAHEAFRKIRNQGEYLLALVNDILDMSAIDHGKMELRAAKFNLNTVISLLIEEYYEQCSKKGISFAVDVAAVEHENLYGDSVRLKQVVFNLLSNAYKYTKTGGSIRVELKEHPIDQKRVELVVSVQDTGCGIAKENLEKIWEPYERITEKDCRDCGGSGLGLPITRNLVTLMGGSIAVESEPGAGSVFTARIPFEMVAGKAEPEAETRKKFDAMHALVVDDDEILGDYQASLLSRLGIHCQCVRHEAEALEQLTRAYEEGRSFDICFINWQMEEGGNRVAYHIRERFDRDALLLVASSYDLAVVERQMRAAGVDYVLAKPMFQSAIYKLMTEIYRRPQRLAAESSIGKDFHGRRVLVAEDNAINAEVLLGYLEQVNVVCDWAKTGKEALDACMEKEEGYYGAVLMDISMPIMDGYQAASEIRRFEEWTKRENALPIIAVSANVFPGDIVRVHEAGMDAYVPKPIDAAALYETLDVYVR